MGEQLDLVPALPCGVRSALDQIAALRLGWVHVAPRSRAECYADARALIALARTMLGHDGHDADYVRRLLAAVRVLRSIRWQEVTP